MKKRITRSEIVDIVSVDEKLKGKIAYNEFLNTTMAMGKMPWDENEEYSCQRIWTDWDDAALRSYLEEVYNIDNVIKVKDALAIVENNNKYHPIRQYLKSIEWDGVERLERLFIDYLGAEDTEYTRAVTRKMLIAAVARVFQPGIKFDNLIVLVGKQGVGKSNIIKLLGKEWHSDSISTVQGKEAYEQLQNSWIIEMAELSATKKAETEAVKHFISKCEDKYRMAYGKRVQSFPRQCVFFATTNDDEFLNDRTGNRRYWPVHVGITQVKKDMWKKDMPEVIDQIWGEALHYYELGEKLTLDKDIEDFARTVQDRCTEFTAKEGVIREYLDRKIPVNWYDMSIPERIEWMSLIDNEELIEGENYRQKICALELWTEIFHGDIKMMTPAIQREFNEILRGIEGWGPYNGSKDGRLRFGKEYGRQKAYVRYTKEEA